MCENCPDQDWGGQLAARNWTFKSKPLAQMNVIPMGSSSWTGAQVRSSSLFRNKDVEKLIIGVDENVFIERSNGIAQLKEEHGIKNEERVIVFGAVQTSDHRKGVAYATDAIRLLALNPEVDCKDIVVVTIGGQIDTTDFDAFGIRYKSLGQIRTREKLAEAYRLADVFISPSLDDAGPMTVNESLMSGTPVVALDLGSQ
jgi:glycosyltransferase involved in cell wall biosynthesis